MLWAGFVYIWIVPFFRPRGYNLWGHYKLRDIYLGIPVGLAALCTTIAMASPARYRRQIAIRITALCVSVVTALFAFDVIYTVGFLGVWRPDYWLDQGHISRKDSSPDNELGFVRKPGISWRGNPIEREAPDLVLRNRANQESRYVHYRTDENGFRNPPGVSHADIVFIGDSYTEAAQVTEEDTFVQRVAEAAGLRAVNLGRGAYGPQQELIVLQRYGLAYNPRYVVWQVFEGNDLGDARNFARWREDSQSQTLPLANRYLNNSLLHRWLFKTSRLKAEAATAQLRYHDGAVRPLHLRYKYVPDHPARELLGFSEMERAIDAGYRLCRSRGIHLLVVFIPTMLRVLEPSIAFNRVTDRNVYLPGGLTQDKRDFGSKLADFCARLGCSYIDTFPALRQRASIDNRYVYTASDEHLDVLGHEVVAEAVLEWLRSHSSSGQK